MRETKSDVSLHALSALRGRVACEAPGQSKQNFKGSFKLDAHPRTSHVSSDQFVFRGMIGQQCCFHWCVHNYTHFREVSRSEPSHLSKAQDAQ